MDNRLTELVLTLQQLRGIGPAAIVNIVRGLSSPDDADLTTLFNTVVEMENQGTLKRVKSFSCDELVEANRKAISIIKTSDKLGIGVISRFDSLFPMNLLDTVDEYGKPSVPVLIFYKGDLTSLSSPSLAVIGSREPSEEGKMAAKYFAARFAENGVNIVSGLARGCDTAGHEGALEAGGTTTAVMAGGLDGIVPSENTELAKKILDNGGMLISEYPVGVRANRFSFVARDRLQASLANATLVAQCGVNSGTMHAAKATLAAGKPLFVVEFKNNCSDNLSEGNRFLLSQGMTAEPITSGSFISNKGRYINLISKSQAAKTLLV